VDEAPTVRDLTLEDRGWVGVALEEVGGRWLARRGELVDADTRPGLVAILDGDPVGVLLYDAAAGAEVELLALATPVRGAGAGTALVDALLGRFPDRAVWVVTTNDNTDALRFFQRLGFRLRAVRIGAIDETRRTIKPAITDTGDHGIPIRDELELVRDPRP
jgi:ribosomal protein S18 acetylase RimI-like enzyme